jgi:hypothetical protein
LPPDHTGAAAQNHLQATHSQLLGYPLEHQPGLQQALGQHCRPWLLLPLLLLLLGLLVYCPWHLLVYCLWDLLQQLCLRLLLHLLLLGLLLLLLGLLIHCLWHLLYSLLLVLCLLLLLRPQHLLCLVLLLLWHLKYLLLRHLLCFLLPRCLLCLLLPLQAPQQGCAAPAAAGLHHHLLPHRMCSPHLSAIQ